jgi:phenylalanine-4-hydroxylase
MRPDCTVEQDYATYTEAQQERWRRLYRRQVELVPGRACDYAVRSPKPRRLAFDLVRVMRSLYRIDAFQETYFVIESLDRLFDATRPDFAPLCRELAGLPELSANAVLPGEQPVS